MIVFINEQISKGTYSFWHGGQLNSEALYGSHIQKKGKYEYGVGLYLTSSYDIAKKYAKGNRTLYKVFINKGKSLNDTYLPTQYCLKFINDYVQKNKKIEVVDRITTKYPEKINGNIFNNFMINYDLINGNNQEALKEFYLEHNIDYLTVDNAFGAHETMVIIFNNRIINNYIRINPKDKIDIFDLSEENDYNQL